MWHRAAYTSGSLFHLKHQWRISRYCFSTLQCSHMDHCSFGLYSKMHILLHLLQSLVLVKGLHIVWMSSCKDVCSLKWRWLGCTERERESTICVFLVVCLLYAVVKWLTAYSPTRIQAWKRERKEWDALLRVGKWIGYTEPMSGLAMFGSVCLYVCVLVTGGII